MTHPPQSAPSNVRGVCADGHRQFGDGEFCGLDGCNARVLTACPSCGVQLVVSGEYSQRPPSTCTDCGGRLPWSRRWRALRWVRRFSPADKNKIRNALFGAVLVAAFSFAWVRWTGSGGGGAVEEVIAPPTSNEPAPTESPEAGPSAAGPTEAGPADGQAGSDELEDRWFATELTADPEGATLDERRSHWRSLAAEHPDDPGVLYQLTITELALGGHREAAAASLALVDVVPTDPRSFVVAGTTLERIGNPTDETRRYPDLPSAASIYRQGHTVDPSDPDLVAAYSSFTAFELRDPDQTISILETALRIDAENSDFWHRLGRWGYQPKGEDPFAVTAVANALLHDPTNSAAVFDLVTLLGRPGVEDHERAWSVVEDALTVEQADPWSVARAGAVALARFDPSDADQRLLDLRLDTDSDGVTLAMAALYHRERDRANEAPEPSGRLELAAAVDLDPRLGFPAHEQLARWEVVDLGADAALQAALRRAPQDLERPEQLLFEMLAAHLRAARDESMEPLDEFARVPDLTDGDRWSLWWNAFWYLGQPELVVEIADRALDMRPHVGVVRVKANALAALGEHPDAIDALGSYWGTVTPDGSIGLARRANEILSQFEATWEERQLWLTRELELDEDPAGVLTRVANVYLDAGDTETALLVLTPPDATSWNGPDFAQVWDQRGRILRDLDDGFEEAVVALEAARDAYRERIRDGDHSLRDEIALGEVLGLAENHPEAVDQFSSLLARDDLPLPERQYILQWRAWSYDALGQHPLAEADRAAAS